jgi:hemerythrin
MGRDIIWTEDLSTGVAEIDEQHKDLFRQLNDLLQACSVKKGKEEIGRFVVFLSDYVILHFAAEEREMAAHSYPAMAGHKAEHEQFKKEIAKLKADYIEHGANIDVVLIAVRMSHDWLREHIKKTDKALGAFLKAQA